MQLNSFIYILFLLLFYLPGFAQQTWTCSGQVVDASSREPLVGANVYTIDFRYGTTTDEYGRYTLMVKNEYNELIASYIGYQSDTCRRVSQGCYFELHTQSLREVVVKADKQVVQKELGTFSPTMEQVKALPTLLGDVDILKAMTLLPGVSGGVEGSSGMLVRGGNLSHNLILLDGTPVYNSSHLFGFMSSFNPDAVKHVELYKGGFPVVYGGRLASVLGVTMKDGNMRKWAGNLSAGLVNSSMVAEGPIWKDRVSCMVAGRLFSLSPLLGLGRKTYDEKYGYWVYDWNSKIKFKLTQNQSLYFSYFQGVDYFLSQEFNTKNQVKWGNRVASIRYNNQLSSRLFADFGVYYNHYRYGANYENTPIDETSILAVKSTIDDWTEKIKMRWVLSPKFRMLLGGALSQKIFTPVDFDFSLKDANAQVIDHQVAKEHLPTRSLVGFWGNEWTPTAHLKLKFGLRSIFYRMASFRFDDTDFRTSASYKLTGIGTFKLAYDEMNQPFHLLTTVGSESPNEIWIPGFEKIQPSEAQQVSFGYSTSFSGSGTYLSVETYLKKMKNLVRYRPGAAYLFAQKSDWRNRVIGGGEGKAYGLEFFIRHKSRRLTGWLGYTMEWSNRRYEQVNKGEWFAANYERRHDLELTASYQISKKWSVAGLFVFQTGRPLTLPTSFYVSPTEPGGVLTRYTLVFDKINGSRTKVYHRMDLSFTRRHRTKRDREAAWSFGAYNVYARNNPFSYVVSIAETDADHNPIRPRIALSQKSLFNLIPSVNYRLKF